MSEFKVGDKVKVLRAFTDEDFPEVGWMHEMEKCVGKEGRVDSIDEDGDIYVRIHGHMPNWCYPSSVLEKVED